MSIADWFSGRFGSNRRREDDDQPRVLGEDEGLAINEDTGEIEGGDDAAASARDSAARRHRSAAESETSAVQGERSIPSVNREQSMQSRVSNALALAAVLLLGGGFLVWYYSTRFSQVSDAELAARRAAEARAAGENKLSPLGRVDPPKFGAIVPTKVEVKNDDFGPPPPQAAAPSGPKPKTAAELELERKLGLPVFSRRSMTDGGATAMRVGTPPPNAPSGMPPHLAALLGGGSGGSALRGDQLASGLGSMLVPTPTPAVAAQVLPTRRFLIPKGTSIDCTLETAIDSTFDGMVTCIGASDVYGADGKVVLLERGTKYVGEKRGDAKQGQARVFVLWNETRTPTGVVANLASPGTDELGRTGLPGYVDTHFWDRFGAAILISVVDGVIRGLSASQQNSNSGTSVVLNPQGTRDVMTEVLRNTIAIPPTIVKNQGDRIQILVARDVDFRPVYALRMTNDGQ